MLGRVALLALLIALVTAGTRGQENETTPDDPPPIHYAYASRGTGFFTIGGQSTRVVRMPFSYRLRPAEKGRWGIKLRFPLSFGFHDLDFELASGRQLRTSVETVALTPGVELEIPVHETWRLRPYAEIGLGHESSGGLEALIYEAGVKSLWLVPRDPLEFRIGAAVKYEGFRLLDSDVRDAYGVAEGGAELRWPGDFEIQGKTADLGVYLILRRFLPEVELVPLRGESLTVTNQFEVGLTLGTRPPPSIRGINLPRLGLAYRWGDRLSSFRLNFGFPF